MTEQKIFEDARPDVLGLSFTLDQDRFDNAKAHCGMSPEQAVRIKLVQLPESDIKGKSKTAMGVQFDPTQPDKTPTILIPVQDRLDFSDKAMSRINRSVVQGIRVLAAQKMFTSFYPLEVAMGFVSNGAAMIYAESYEFARNYVVDRPDHFILATAGEAGIDVIEPAETKTGDDSEEGDEQ